MVTIECLQRLMNMINKHWKIVAGLIATFLLIVVGLPILLTRTWGPECLKFTESTGWIGDTLGGITAPFIGLLNVALLIWTLWKQIDFNDNQLKAQKEEQFKAVFFQMLQTQRELLHEVRGSFLSRNMKGDVEDGKVAGIDFFLNAGMELATLFQVFEGQVASNSLIDQNVRNRYAVKDTDIIAYSRADNAGKMRIVYEKFFARHLEMGNYFRHLYHILKFISTEKENALKDETDEKEKKAIEKWYKSYADLLQATLSVEELRMAYYNCSSFDNAKKLCKEFQFVENLTKKNLIRPDKDVMEGFKIKEDY